MTLKQIHTLRHKNTAQTKVQAHIHTKVDLLNYIHTHRHKHQYKHKHKYKHIYNTYIPVDFPNYVDSFLKVTTKFPI